MITIITAHVHKDPITSSSVNAFSDKDHGRTRGYKKLKRITETVWTFEHEGTRYTIADVIEVRETKEPELKEAVA